MTTTANPTPPNSDEEESTAADLHSPCSNTALEACFKLKITQPTLYELINSGKLRSYKIGRHRYITDDAIRDFQTEAEATERKESQRARVA